MHRAYMSSDVETLKKNLLFTVSRVQESVIASGVLLPDSEMATLAELLHTTISSIGARTFGHLCPNLTSCDGSCFTAEQGVWKAAEDVVHQGLKSVLLCSPTSSHLLLEPITALLWTLQQFPCRALNRQLKGAFKLLSERVLCLTTSDGETASFGSCKQTVLRQLQTLQQLGDRHTQKLTGAYRAFNDILVSISHPENWCKSLSTADRAVLLLVELIAGKPWLEPTFRHKLTSSLQTQATGSESQLTYLWTYLAEALQDQEFLDACGGVMACTNTNSAGTELDHSQLPLMDDAKARHVGKCAQQLLADIGCYLPDVCTMAAVTGALDLIASPGRKQLPEVVLASLCGLFVSHESLELILTSSFLQSSTSLKGCQKALDGVLELGDVSGECLELLRLLLQWSGVEQNAPVECRTASLEGYKACLRLLDSDAFCQVPADAHATKLQVVFSQDSSTKVRRAGFLAWLGLQELWQRSFDCNDWDIDALQVVKGRCLDRDKQIQSVALQVLEPLSATRLRQLWKLEECYYLMYHAAQHKHEYIQEAVLAMVEATLAGCPEALAQRFRRSMMHAVADVKELPRKAVLAHMCHQLVLKTL